MSSAVPPMLDGKPIWKSPPSLELQQLNELKRIADLLEDLQEGILELLEKMPAQPAPKAGRKVTK